MTGEPAPAGPAGGPPRRVRVTHPRMDEVRRAPARALTREIDEQTQLGELYVRSLVRSQLRLAVSVCLIAIALLAGVAAAFALTPALGHQLIWGIPLAWLVLGLLIYPVLIGLAAYTVGHAERNEQDFVELVHRERQR
ncbi:MAG: hypothetical protein ABI140_01950 [Jatrophihabitantaceae bacterium]